MSWTEQDRRSPRGSMAFSDFKGVRGICWKVMGGVYGVPRSKGTFDGSYDMAVKVV